MLKGHGDDIYGGLEILANFSTNIHYKNNLFWLKDFIDNKWECLNSYPEPDAYSLKEQLAIYHSLSADNFIIGNGATEIFYLVAHAFYKSKTLIPIPSFSEYEDACCCYKHIISFCNIDEFQIHKNNYDLVIICNPNNPDGRIYNLKDIEIFLKENSNTTLLIDEAFSDFTIEKTSAIELIKQYPNLLICKSMTKNYAIPGLRLGYLIGDSKLIKNIERNKQPWSVNALAIETGKYLLQNSTLILPNAKELINESMTFQQQINDINGYRCIRSHTPFFIVETIANSTILKEFLLRNYSILIRDASNFRSLNEHYFRVNTLDTKRNNLLINALKEYEF